MKSVTWFSCIMILHFFQTTNFWQYHFLADSLPTHYVFFVKLLWQRHFDEFRYQQFSFWKSPQCSINSYIRFEIKSHGFQDKNDFWFISAIWFQSQFEYMILGNSCHKIVLFEYHKKVRHKGIRIKQMNFYNVEC